jgi:hypothetical protein
METPEQKELERFIHAQLTRLPEREAPADLARNVLKAIEARRNLPWWKQPFTSWPKANQALLFVALAVVFGGTLYLAWAPAGQVSADSLIDKARSFGWLASVAETIFSSLWLALRNLPWTWLIALGAVFVTMYAACVAAGFALYRVAAHRSPSYS